MKQKQKWLMAWRVFADEHPEVAAQMQEAIITSCEVLKPLSSDDQVRAYTCAPELLPLRTMMEQYAQSLNLDTRDTVACVRWILAACLGTLMQLELRRR